MVSETKLGFFKIPYWAVFKSFGLFSTPWVMDRDVHPKIRCLFLTWLPRPSDCAPRGLTVKHNYPWAALVALNESYLYLLAWISRGQFGFAKRVIYKTQGKTCMWWMFYLLSLNPVNFECIHYNSPLVIYSFLGLPNIHWSHSTEVSTTISVG